MPGQTNNTDHLSAFNQIVTAINDLKIILETGTPPVNVASILGNIQNNIESLEATLSARSQAETVAQNTNFADLITAIKSAQLSGCGCCGGGGYAPPSTEGVEGGDPPTNLSSEIVWATVEGAPTQTTPGTSVYYNRKCKMANGLVEDVIGIIQVAKDAGLGPQLGFSIAMPLIGAILGAAGGSIAGLVGGVVGGVAGAVIGLAVAIVDEGVDLGLLLVELTNNQEDLVCALYNSSSPVDAWMNFDDVLDNNSVGIANRSVVSALLIVDVLDHLYFKGEEYLEAKLAGYTPPYPCDCGCQAVVIYGEGSPCQTPFTMQNANYLGNQYGELYSLKFGYSEPVTLRLTNVSGWAQQNVADYGPAYRVKNGAALVFSENDAGNLVLPLELTGTEFLIQSSNGAVAATWEHV